MRQHPALSYPGHPSVPSESETSTLPSWTSRSPAAALGVPTTSQVRDLVRNLLLTKPTSLEGEITTTPVVTNKEMNSVGSGHLPKITQLLSGESGFETTHNASRAPACSPWPCRHLKNYRDFQLRGTAEKGDHPTRRWGKLRPQEETGLG